MESIKGFNGAKDLGEIEDLLERVGCCVVTQPEYIAPAERTIRDHAQITQTLDHAEMLASKSFWRLFTCGTPSISCLVMP